LNVGSLENTANLCLFINMET